MKKVIFIFLVVFFSSLVTFSQNIKENIMSLHLSLNEVMLKIKGTVAVKPGFTPGNHSDDFFLKFWRYGDVYSASLPFYKRKMSSGRIGGGCGIYHISSGYVPEDLEKPLQIKVSFLKGNTLLWCEKECPSGVVTEKFSSYFEAREFPLILVPSNKYIKRVSRFNDKDSMTVFYAWEDSTTKAALPIAFSAVDSAASIIGNLFPRYLHRFVENYAGRKFSLVVILNKQVLTGLEHYNAPYIASVPEYLSVGEILHTLLHSFIGKSVIPYEYMEEDGKFHPSDALGFYEGLTTFMSMKYEKNFQSQLSGTLFRAKIDPECSDLTKISVCGAETEKWYGDGYLYWLYMQSIGLEAEEFTRWLFEDNLVYRPVFPIRIHWSDVLDWISEYNEKLGKKAKEVYQGQYVSLAFDTLRTNGWSPIPVWEIPRWYELYIGPYPIKDGGILLPTDNYPIVKGYPKSLIEKDGSKMLLEAKVDNPALMFIKSHPDSTFQIEFSDGSILEVENKLKFSDGSPYFMYGTIDINDSNRKFWQSLNVYIK